MSRMLAGRTALAFLGVMVLILSGCAQARWVKQTGTDGIIAIPYNDGEGGTHRQEAYKMANAKWGMGGYEIVAEEEVPIGTTTRTTGNESTRSAAVAGSRTESTRSGGSRTVAAGAARSNTRSSETTTSRVDTEYHIHFQQK